MNEIILKLTPQQLQVIGKYLGAGPYVEVAPVIADIQRQVDAQQPAQQGAQETKP